MALEEVRGLLWEDRDDEALARLDQLAWQQTGSVAAERMRQDLRIARGARAAVVSELLAVQQGQPADPDLVYLRVRVLEDPRQRAADFGAALADTPDHVWLRLGAAATAQDLDDWRRAARLLEGLPRWRDAEDFRRIVLARQALHGGDPRSAFALLEAAAFVDGEESALLTWLETAERIGEARLAERARAEIALRRAVAWGLPLENRIDAVFARLEAEQPWLRGAHLDTVLARIDAWSALAEVPAGWAQQPRYAAPPFAELVRPEPAAGGPAAAWAEAGRVLLAGAALGRGTEVHLLQQVTVHRLDWPGTSRSLEVLAARGARSASGVLPLGGAVLRGFFLRLEQADATARAVERELQDFQIVTPPAALVAASGALESWDLASRLRAQEGAAAEAGRGDRPGRAALRALAVHEAGHLPETLPWTRYGVPVMQLLPRFLGSLSRYGDPVLWLEYHAQLRALASGRATRWLLAETVHRANRPRDAYHRPYRDLLEDLVDRGTAEGLPHLAHWDQLPPQRIAELAASVAREQGITLLPEEGLRALDSLVEELDAR